MFCVKNVFARKFYKRIDSFFELDIGKYAEFFCQKVNHSKKCRKKYLEELIEENNKLEILVSRIADGVMLVDTDLRIVFINTAAIQVFDLELVIIEGKKIAECLPSEINKQLLPVFKDLINMPATSASPLKNREISITFVLKEQKTVRIFLNLVVAPTRGFSKGVVMTIRDVTKETQLNEAKNQFISNVSHELRTPLSNILSFLETLYDYNELLTDSQKLEFLNTANNETRRLVRLVNDVLNLSRLELHREYQRESFEILVLMEEVVCSYQLIIKKKNIKLLIQVDPNLFQVYANYDLILQSIYNLLGNAIKFTHTNGKIVLRALYIKDCLVSINKIRIEVSDTGIGIAYINQRLIFERFLRVENIGNNLEGSGLGLSIANRCVHQHNSCIYVRSELYNGTTFWFDL